MKLLIILGFLKGIICCRSDAGINEDHGHHGPNDTQFLGNLSGWGVPEMEGHNNWNDFLIYYKNVSMNDDVSWDDFFSQSKNAGFPKEWQGYGPGSPGVSPPPWAYIAGNYGRPDFCFQFPAVGNCHSKIMRWAYNPQTQACRMFYYSGCGGNDNNFVYKASCEEACMKTPTSPCEPQDKIHFEDLLDGHG